jgi:hypothetical protein
VTVLTVGNIKALSGNTIVMPAGHSIISPGSVIQCVITRYDAPTTYTTGNSLGGVEMTDLRVSIRPKRSNSMIMCTFQVFSEGASTHDYVMTVFKNGAVPDGPYAGFNNQAGRQFWSGYAMPLPYETDYNSTPFTSTMRYFDFPKTTDLITYAPGVQNTAGTSYTWFLNRTAGSVGTTSYENGASISMAWEIAQ